MVSHFIGRPLWWCDEYPANIHVSLISTHPIGRSKIYSADLTYMTHPYDAPKDPDVTGAAAAVAQAAANKAAAVSAAAAGVATAARAAAAVPAGTGNTAAGGISQGANDDFMLEQYKALRREVDHTIEQSRRVLLWTVLASGIIWSWSLSNIQHTSNVLQIIQLATPAAVALLCFIYRSGLHHQLQILYKHITVIETYFNATSHGNGRDRTNRPISLPLGFSLSSALGNRSWLTNIVISISVAMPLVNGGIGLLAWKSISAPSFVIAMKLDRNGDVARYYSDTPGDISQLITELRTAGERDTMLLQPAFWTNTNACRSTDARKCREGACATDQCRTFTTPTNFQFCTCMD